MSKEYTFLSNIPVSRNHVKNCMFSSWYEKFKNYTPTAEIVKPLPHEFIQYLEQDGIKLPYDNINVPYHDREVEISDYSDWELSDSNNHEDSDREEVDPIKHFPEFHEKLKQIIKKLGSVTPKLNWSSPKDASWILVNNTIKCNEINDLYLILNASNYIMHDLQYPFDECYDKSNNELVEYELVLRKWFDINPALEFRVFIKDKVIVGVSQRDMNYYDYLEPLNTKFKSVIKKFVKDVAILNFPDESFVLDLYIPRPFSKVWLIDINPFSRKTDPLLFSWTELLGIAAEIQNDDYELRFVTKYNIAHFAAKEHSENHVPTDIVHASLDATMMRELVEKWKELLDLQKLEDE